MGIRYLKILIIALAMGFALQACAAGVYNNRDDDCHFCEHWRNQAMARLTPQDSGGLAVHDEVSR